MPLYYERVLYHIQKALTDSLSDAFEENARYVAISAVARAGTIVLKVGVTSSTVNSHSPSLMIVWTLIDDTNQHTRVVFWWRWP